MDASPLSRLPAELRNEIFELAYTSEQPLLVIYNHNNATVRLSPTSLNCYCRLLALRQTCKQIRQETRALVWARNTIVLYAEEGHIAKAVGRLGTQIGEDSFRALHHLVIDVHQLDQEMLHIPLVTRTCWNRARTMTTRDVSLRFDIDVHMDEPQYRGELSFKDIDDLKLSTEACMHTIEANAAAIMEDASDWESHCFKSWWNQVWEKIIWAIEA